MNYRFLLITLIIMIAFNLSAVHDDAGTSGFSFLKLVTSARVSALGYAFTGLADDVNAVFYNPAGLIQLNSRQVQASYMNYFQGIHCGSVVFAYPRNERETYALFAQFLTATEEKTLADEFGELVETGEDFGMSDLIIGVSASRYIIPVINLGLTLKFIRESLDDKSASAIAADIGVIHQTTNESVKVGIAVKNLGYQISYYTDSEYSENLPIVVTAGLSYNPEQKFKAVLDVNKPLEYDFSVNLGIEYQLNQMLDLRAGYKSESGDWRAGGEYEIFSGLSFGFGLNWKNMVLDYSISSYGDLGLVNQLSLKYNF